jgi:prepilin-type N-terminal cleavage/methylation domain-containing protein
MTYRPHRRRGIAGFTLTELMITIIIAGIILSIAGPRFMRYISYLTARGATSEVVADLTLARTQAVREGRTVSFRLDGNGVYRVTVDATPARTIKRVDLRRDYPGVVLTLGAAQTGALSFDSRGMVRSHTTDPPTIIIQRGTGVDSLHVSLVGRVRRAR